jgi:hypothetical protein
VICNALFGFNETHDNEPTDDFLARVSINVKHTARAVTIFSFLGVVLQKKNLATQGISLVKTHPMPQPLSWDSGLAWDDLTPGITWDGVASNTNTHHPMASDNRISLEITPAQKTAIVDAVTALKTALQGITINLTKDERQSLPKIGDKTLAFDEKCKAYMAARPELVPGFIDAAELAKDRKVIDDLLPCLREVAPIAEAIEDTITLAYSDIYVADLAFHANVKQAAKRGVPGTDTIYDDLRERFPGRPRAATPPPPTP